MTEKKRNPMNTRSNKELLQGHFLLHVWRGNNWKQKPSNWTKKQIVKEHKRLVKVMLKRDMNHDSPLTL